MNSYRVFSRNLFDDFRRNFAWTSSVISSAFFPGNLKEISTGVVGMISSGTLPGISVQNPSKIYLRATTRISPGTPSRTPSGIPSGIFDGFFKELFQKFLLEFHEGFCLEFLVFFSGIS